MERITTNNTDRRPPTNNNNEVHPSAENKRKATTAVDAERGGAAAVERSSEENGGNNNDNKKAKLGEATTAGQKTKEEEEAVRQLSLEERSILDGQQRVKFRTELIDTKNNIPPPPREDEWKPLARALATSEALGAAPVCPREGFVFGNGAILSSKNNHQDDGSHEGTTSSSPSSNTSSIVVSKSGRYAGTDYSRSQFVRVVGFDNETWTATYGGVDNGSESSSSNSSSSVGKNNNNKNKGDNARSIKPDMVIKPSSDTPLLWNALIVAPKRFSWTLQPRFVLHGHSCTTQEEAEERGFPCSTHETLFSTPDDLQALMELFEQYPYPANQVYVRKNHGFFLLAQNEEEACRIFREKLAPRR